MTARCRCSHVLEVHDADGNCWSVACGCAKPRPDDGTRWPPARFDERFDPSPEPVERKIS